MKKKDPNDFKKEIENLCNGEYTVLGTYKTNKDEIMFRHNCDKCNNNEFPMRPNDFLSGNRCPKCSKKYRKDINDFKKEVKELCNDEYTVISKEYKNNKEKIMFRHNCDKCNNNEFPMRPNDFLSGKRCPKCKKINTGNRCRMSPEEFREKLKNLYGDEYEALEDYKGSQIKIMVRHNCEYCNNHEYPVTPNRILAGNKCPRCTNQEPINNKEVVQFKSDKKYGKDKYTILTDPKNIDSNIDIKCNECGEIFTIKVKYFLNRKTLKYGCPKCLSNESVAILFIKDYLNENNIIFNDEVKYDKMIYKDHLKIDLLFNNIHLEYDGDQHFRGWSSNSKKKNLQQSRDSVKNDYCLNNSLILIRIPYTEEANLEEILDAIINYNEKFLIKHNCLIIKENLVVNKPKIYSWYKENEINILNERKED